MKLVNIFYFLLCRYFKYVALNLRPVNPPFQMVVYQIGTTFMQCQMGRSLRVLNNLQWVPIITKKSYTFSNHCKYILHP